MDRRLAAAVTQSGVCMGESLKLSLNVSFTLDSTGSNPVHSIKSSNGGKSASESARGARLSSISPIATQLIDYMKSRFILVCLQC